MFLFPTTTPLEKEMFRSWKICFTALLITLRVVVFAYISVTMGAVYLKQWDFLFSAVKLRLKTKNIH